MVDENLKLTLLLNISQCYLNLELYEDALFYAE